MYMSYDATEFLRYTWAVLSWILTHCKTGSVRSTQGIITLWETKVDLVSEVHEEV